MDGRSSTRITKGTIRAFWAVIGVAFRKQPWLTAASLIAYPIAFLEFAVVAVGLRITVDGLWQGAPDRVTAGLTIIVIGLCTFYMVDSVGETRLSWYQSSGYDWKSAAITPDSLLVVSRGSTVYALRPGVGPAASSWPMLQHDARRTGRAGTK